MSSEAAGSVILSLVQDMVNEPFEEAIRFVRLDNSKGAVARLKDMVYSKEVSDGTGRDGTERNGTGRRTAPPQIPLQRVTKSPSQSPSTPPPHFLHLCPHPPPPLLSLSS